MVEKYPQEEGVEEKNLQNKLIQSQIKQTEILEKQKNFNELLVLTAIIIAFSSALEYFGMKYNWSKPATVIDSLLSLTLFFVLIIFLGCIIRLIYKLLKLISSIELSKIKKK